MGTDPILLGGSVPTKHDFFTSNLNINSAI